MKFVKIICMLFLLIFYKINVGVAQKKNIDSNAYTQWSSVGGAAINGNGKYVYYTIENEPLGRRTWVVQSIDNNWKKSFKDTKGQCFISAKERDYAIILNQKDSLAIISLGENLIQYVPNVESFTTCRNGEGEWISYQLKQSDNKLTFLNLNTGKKYVYEEVINNIIDDDGQTVILQTEKKNNNQTLQELNWIDLGTGKNTLIWKGLKAKNIVLDAKYHQLAFICENGLFSYNNIRHKLHHLINNQIASLDSELRLGGIKRFSNDGTKLFIDLKEEEKTKPKARTVEVWSYLDSKLQSVQEKENVPSTYTAVINMIDGKIIQLEHAFEYLSFNLMEKSSDTIGTIFCYGKKRDGQGGTSELVSLKNGKRTLLKYSLVGLSPMGKYMICFDPEKHIYFSYNTKTRVYQNISKEFFKVLSEPHLDRARIAGWLEHDEGVLFYDAYDIWRLDLSGKKAPINLTNGYGRNHHIVLSIIYGEYNHYPINKIQKLMLIAFNLQSKKQGFYSLELGKVKEPQLLSMDNYFYGPQEGVIIGISNPEGIAPIKAKKADVYLVGRMSADKSFNYFTTRDFKTFKALSNIYPEHNYNWYTTELHTWTSLDGKTLQGVLFKPENFDPTKRYPVIFNYYEGKSNNLNMYIKPETLCGGCNIDIPTYVSNGYLVFTPDIVYKIGDPMQGTYDAVVSAANYVSTLSFVDSTKMGIQGCSWGGIQTNYLVTHTNLFAAASTSSGIADWIANYGRIYNGTNIGGGGQNRMEKSIWEVPDAYIKTSPIFQLHKVTTPFLIMHTKGDKVCSFDDAMELYIGLRRLGKRSWLLAYPEGNHGVYGNEAKDFSARMMQFFDHYLKAKPAPIWMTRGIPAERRGLDDGFAYDTKIKTPGPGLLTPEEQKTVDSLMTKKPILIELK